MTDEYRYTRRTSVDTRPQPQRTPSGNISLKPSPSPSYRTGTSPSPSAHRQSFNDPFRGMPPSPRQGRQLSLSQAQMLELINNPPTAGHDGTDERFRGRDWRNIAVGELVEEADLKWVEIDEGIEQATNVLTESGGHALLVRKTKQDRTALATFEYRDLNQYLLFATGQLQPDEEHIPIIRNLANKAQTGQKISLKDAKSLGANQMIFTLPHTANLTLAVEAFGGGVHRIIIVEEGTDHVVGLLSQLRLVNFLWENGRSFPAIDKLYTMELQELGVGNQLPICINGDKPLKEALRLMNDEGITSLAVVDNQFNVVGNISNVDVKLLTSSASAPLLDNTCIHFISVILSSRGMMDGKDSYPVFYVHGHSTLAHTVAKLVATKSHRMWIVDSPTPTATPPGSAPPTPHLHTALPHSSSSNNTPTTSTSTGTTTHNHSNASASTPIIHPPSPITISHPPSTTQPPYALNSATQSLPPLAPLSASTPAVSAAALPGANLSGRLSGVISLTDVLNLFARASGMQPSDPEEARRARRGSSASVRSGVSGRGVMLS